MSKKVVSILLSVAMLAAVCCVGVSAAADEASKDSEKVTYYFLAPDNYFKTEAGALNSDVGFYYWQPSENATWPGEKATPAPEVDENAFKIEIGNNDETGTVIFNAFVDAGNPADPEKKKVAHQTVNIDLEEEDYYGMIYVLANDDEHRSVDESSGAIKTSGNWFSIDPAADNYYKNSYNYTTYGTTPAPVETDTDTEEPVSTDAETPVASNKAHHEGDTVTVTYSIGNVPGMGAFGSEITYDTSVLELTEIKQTYTAADPDVAATVVLNPNPKQFAQGKGVWKVGDPIKVAATGEPFGGTADFAGDPASVVVCTFKALVDFDDADMALKVQTNKVVSIKDEGDTKETLVNSVDDDASAYVHLENTIDCPHAAPVESDTDTTTKPAETDTTTKPVDTDTTTKPAETDTTTKPATTDTSKVSTDTTKASSSDKKGTPDSATKKDSSTSSAKSGTSTTTTGTGTATVQTAGTFAVISLVVILMVAAAVVLYTRKKTEE